MVNNYQNSKIYKIFSTTDDSICYIGSTAQEDLNNRLIQHKSRYRCFNNQNTKYKPSRAYNLFEKYGIDNCMIELIASYPCSSRKELENEEAKYIKSLNAINKNIPNRYNHENHQEYMKEYYDENREYYKEYMKEYYKNNIEKAREYQKRYHDTHNENLKEYNKLYYDTHKEKAKEYQKMYYDTHNENLKEYKKKYRDTHKEKTKEYQKMYREKIRLLKNSLKNSL